MASIIVKSLGQTDFEATWRAMQAFTLARTADTADEIWLTEHAPVYSLGLNKKAVRMPMRADIPVIETDRGGKMTYHGVGQAVIYLLLDLTRYHLRIQQLVNLLEQAVIALLAEHKIKAHTLANAPGVYVHIHDNETAKIASLGLRIKNNCCYHGLSVNVDMDLSPFDAIDPCGFAGLKVTQVKDVTKNGMASKDVTVAKINEALAKVISRDLINIQNAVQHQPHG